MGERKKKKKEKKEKKNKEKKELLKRGLKKSKDQCPWKSSLAAEKQNFQATRNLKKKDYGGKKGSKEIMGSWRTMASQRKVKDKVGFPYFRGLSKVLFHLKAPGGLAVEILTQNKGNQWKKKIRQRAGFFQKGENRRHSRAEKENQEPNLIPKTGAENVKRDRLEDAGGRNYFLDPTWQGK